MEDKLKRLPNETEKEHCRRLTIGKLTDKTLSEVDYVELSPYVFGKEYSSDVCRRMMYGIKYFVGLEDKEEIKQLPKTQFDKIKDSISELDIKKRENQLVTTQLNKVKRELIKPLAIAEEMKQFFIDNGMEINIPAYCSEEVEGTSDYEMILHITDWHIGSIIIDCKGNNYNWEIANQRINKLINECNRYKKMYGIKRIHLMSTGDLIEHISMRKNQSQYCEFTQSVQINKAIELVFRLIVGIQKDCIVEYDSIPGNHDRTNGEFAANYDGDSADVVVREQLKNYIELTNNEHVHINMRKDTDKEIVKDICGFKCKFIHGDVSILKDDRQALKSEISMDEAFYDLYFKGHLHNFKLTSENRGRYIIGTGCLSGYNDFSTRFGCTTVASQTIVILGKGKELELIKDVQLG
jgi:uncharacterized protein (UPF0335 family)